MKDSSMADRRKQMRLYAEEGEIQSTEVIAAKHWLSKEWQVQG